MTLSFKTNPSCPHCKVAEKIIKQHNNKKKELMEKIFHVLRKMRKDASNFDGSESIDANTAIQRIKKIMENK